MAGYSQGNGKGDALMWQRFKEFCTKGSPVADDFNLFFGFAERHPRWAVAYVVGITAVVIFSLWCALQ
jgi:hypothetical protein